MGKVKEPLIKSTMNRVATNEAKRNLNIRLNEMIARRTTQVVEAHGHVTGAASRLREVRLGHLSRTCACAYRVEVATLQHRRVVPVKGIPAGSGSKLLAPARQRCEYSFLMQPIRDLALRAVCYVKLLANGIAIRVVTFLASHPAKPLSRPCGT